MMYNYSHMVLVLFAWLPVCNAGKPGTVDKKTSYKPLGLGQSFSGKIIAVGGTSRIGCSVWCSSDVRCEVFQQKGTRPGSCYLIYANPIQHDKDTFTSTENSLIYKKVVMMAKRTWPNGTEPVVYLSFNTLANVIAVREGPKKKDFYPLVDGKINKALGLDRSRKQWIDLGVLSEACVTVPNFCVSKGAAVSFWINLIDFPVWAGIISSKAKANSRGIYVTGFNNKIRITFDVNGDPNTARFSVDLKLLSGWNHVTVNYMGPNNGQGIRVYRNGLQKGSDDIKFEPSLSVRDGRTAVGRLYTAEDGNYSSFEIDELAFFNAKLSDDKIGELFDLDK